MITDLPLRGSTPPPWFGSLSGLDRLAAIRDGLIPRTPLSHLFGLRVQHFAPGSVVMTMPATAANELYTGQLDGMALIESCLSMTAMSALQPGQRCDLISLNADGIRPTQGATGVLIARGQVVNAGGVAIYAQCNIQDTLGRLVYTMSGHALLSKMDPPPPPAPARLDPVTAPVYSTPDPWEREVKQQFTPNDWVESGGAGIVEAIRRGQLWAPCAETCGVHFDLAENDRLAGSFPASEWFCDTDRTVSRAVLLTVSNMVSLCSGLSLMPPGHGFAGLGISTLFHRSTPADGRPLRFDVDVVAHDRNVARCHARIVDADGQPVCSSTATALHIDVARRKARRKPRTEAKLLALLFADIVNSTGHIERLGNGAWSELLGRYREQVRRAVDEHRGTEVDNAGDGFFLRFDSPQKAFDCARSIQQAARNAGIGVRCGIHLGECETAGRAVSGMPVHVAARIQAQAAPGEILVSSTMRDLLTGSGVECQHRGEHALKGVPGTWRLFAASRGTSA